ncbi:MAG: MBL fold metallo-hydrolase [Candidatus Zixiibacteriota bacterium]|nr:MAG: MBL fold metallo-hydrolase [candidate division Zixibacteria bacterium]
MSDPRNDIYNFDIGRFNCAVICDGFTEYATAAILFSRAPRKELGEKLRFYELNPDKIRCFNNCLLIKNNSEITLVDTGFGHLAGNYPGAENAGMLVENLKKNGYKTEKIDKVIFTHYHFDHIGGGLDRKGNPAFPHAVYYMNKKDWQKGASTESYGKKILLDLESRMELFDGGIEISPGIKVIPAPGHTPGHSIVKIESAGGELLYASDLAAHQIHLERPGWSMAHEYDPDLAARTRREIFGYAADKKIPMLAYHLPFPGLGYLHDKNGGWSWRPLGH